jgi:hypothetical protein
VVQAAFHPRPKKGEKWPKGRPHPERLGSDFNLSGLARCPECGAAILGSSDHTRRRKKPYRYHTCGRKCRVGGSACPIPRRECWSSTARARKRAQRAASGTEVS